MASSSSKALLVLALVAVVLPVQRLARQLAAAIVEELAVERVAAVAVGRQQREAVLEQHALVDREVGELGGHDHAAARERAAPDERHLGRVARFAAPAPDDLVAEVELPVGV